MATKRARAARAASTSATDLQGLLRGAGLRSTAPRVAVLGDLLARTTPASHGDLCEALGPDGFDRATLYRNLIDLADAGLVARIDVGDHVWRFEVKRRLGEHAHPHFVCRECKVVSCLTDVTVRIVRSADSPRSLATKDVAIQITAVCDACS